MSDPAGLLQPPVLIRPAWAVQIAGDPPGVSPPLRDLGDHVGSTRPASTASCTRADSSASHNPRARRRFAVYWALIHPASGLVRRDMLATVRRRATPQP